MSDAFDVCLSYSSKDKAVVRPIAERLLADGLRVCFDEAAIEGGLDRSRVLVLCMSANASGADWARLEAGTFRFRDPLNKERRFIPLRLDDAPVKESLAQISTSIGGRKRARRVRASPRSVLAIEARSRSDSGGGEDSFVRSYGRDQFRSFQSRW